MASVYWRLAKEMGWSYGQIDELSLGDFDEIAERWDLRPDDDVDDGSPPPGAPRELSEEEFRRIANAEQAFANKHGMRSPFV